MEHFDLTHLEINTNSLVRLVIHKCQYMLYRHSWALTCLIIAPDEQAGLAIRCVV